MNPPLVSIIVSNLNGMTLGILRDCLTSLMKPTYKNWELIVVDNSSTDQSVEFVNRLFKNKENCQLIQNPVNMYSQGLNLGAEVARGEYLAYFNNDVAIEKKYFEELLGQFKKNKRLAIAQGKLLNYFAHNKIDSAGETMDKYGNPITIGAGEIDAGQFDKSEEILSASGSACIIKKSIFDKVGKYDPDYGIGYEDMDLALRLRRLGYKIMRFPKAIVYHKRATTDLADFVKIQVKRHFNKNRLATMIKNYPPSLLATTLPVTLVLYTLIGLYEWIVRKNWSIGLTRFSAMLWVLINLPKLIYKRLAIKNLGGKIISKKEIALFSNKSLTLLFKDFSKTK